MKSVDRKIVVLTLFGVVLVAPFLVIASILGIHAATLAPAAKPEVFCLLLAVASIAARISDGQIALTNTAEERKQVRKNPGEHLSAGRPS